LILSSLFHKKRKIKIKNQNQNQNHTFHLQTLFIVIKILFLTKKFWKEK